MRRRTYDVLGRVLTAEGRRLQERTGSHCDLAAGFLWSARTICISRGTLCHIFFDPAHWWTYFHLYFRLTNNVGNTDLSCQRMRVFPIVFPVLQIRLEIHRFEAASAGAGANTRVVMSKYTGK